MITGEADWAIKNNIVGLKKQPDFKQYINAEAFNAQFPNANTIE